MAYNKIGFHLGPGGRRTGIGDYMQALDNASIPFVIKSADDYGVCHEATEYSNANHVIVYRMSTAGQNDGIQYDVPDYNADPYIEAGKHWSKTLAKLPPEFNKSKVWLEVINEVDKNRSNWLGHFGRKIAELAVSNGYKILLFGWSSGEPEKDDWKTHGMKSFLEFAEQNRDSVGVAIHEYSYDKQSIMNGYPNKVGRFDLLFSACDDMLISRPQIVITEWGWEYADIPGSQLAMEHINTVASIYAVYPEILGAAIWHLGGGFGGIAVKAQQLIPLVKNWTLDSVFEGPAPAPQPPSPTPSPTPSPPESNLLLNPSFEEGWWHKDGRPEYQIPNGWDIDVVTGQNNFDPAHYVEPEVRVLPKHFLPEDEWDDFIFGGNQTVKIFKGGAPIKVKFFTKHPLTLAQGTYRFTVNLFADLVWKYEDGNKVYSDDPLAGNIRFYKNGVQGDWAAVDFGTRNTISYQFSVNSFSEDVKVGFAIRSPFPLSNNGWFIDKLSLSMVDDDGVPPPIVQLPRQYKRHIHLLPQNATDLEVAVVMAEAKAARQSVTWSVDDAFITHNNLTDLTVEVWDEERIFASVRIEDWVNQYYPPIPNIIRRSFDE